MSASDWKRVSRADPCPICERADWCLVSTDGTAAFLASLFQSGADDLPENLPGDWHVRWDGRAADLERDAGLPRELAEHRALVEVAKAMTTEY